jgi:signal transduction histidine kinase
MTSIRSVSEILRDMEMSPEEHGKYAGIIHDEALRLTRLLNDLLDLSVLENGQVTLHVHTGQLSDLLDRAIGASGVQERGLQILRNHSRVDVALTTDLDRLVQVFVNVIANAQKYCVVENPILDIKVRVVDGRDVIDFIDNGDGISTENQTIIFEKFARIEDEGKAGGAGLGLAICREILGRLGGQISYLPGQKGAAFRVTLPEHDASAKSPDLLASQ